MRKIEDLSGKHFGEWTVLYFHSRTKYNDIKWMCRCSCGIEKLVYSSSLKSGGSKSCGCKKKIDMLGKKFGRLTVIEKAEPRKYIIRWKCQCDCGNIIETDGISLRKGLTKSCGCYSKEVLSKSKSVDMSGKKFGRLTVLERKGSNEYRHALWECICDCGKIKIIDGQELRKGTIQSCGCLKLELLLERTKTKEFADKYRGNKNPSFGIVRHSKGEWFNLPSGEKIWIRSSYEKRVLDVLVNHNIRFLYEPTTFNLGNYTYTPDIFLNDYNMYWEIKGYLRKKDRDKLTLFSNKYYSININIIQINDIVKLESIENITNNINKFGKSLNEYLGDIKKCE